ncbi:MAG: peptide chain release factor 3, partial [Hyphomicrobiales bacterium]
DREARDPFELIDQVQEELALDASPIVWPLGSGSTFQGCIHLKTGVFLHNTGPGKPAERIQTTGIMDEKLDALVDAEVLAEARDSVELAAGGYAEFDHNSFLEGHLSPVIFGSALREFSVKELLDVVADFAPSPQPLMTENGEIGPEDKYVSGFVFKVQANMDPNHRDRIAFLRLVSGHFKRGMKLKHVRTGKAINVHSPLLFFAQDRQVADDAWPGDVIGIPNHGTLRVGDTLSEKDGVRFTGLPAFAPEILRRVRLSNSSKTKQLRQGLQDLAEEGLAQVFKPFLGSQWIVGVVGILQLDVMVSRIGGEYGAEITFEPAPFVTARWVTSEDKIALEGFRDINQTAFAEDRDGAPVYLARSQWELDRVVKDYPELKFSKTKEL